MNPGGQMNMQELLQQAQKMQQQLVTAQQELAETEIEGSAAGGLVKATLNGQGELIRLSISPEAIDGEDPQETADTLADLVLAAVRDASREAAEMQQQKMGPLAEGLGGAGSGLGLPGF